MLRCSSSVLHATDWLCVPNSETIHTVPLSPYRWGTKNIYRIFSLVVVFVGTDWGGRGGGVDRYINFNPLPLIPSWPSNEFSESSRKAVNGLVVLPCNNKDMQNLYLMRPSMTLTCQTRCCRMHHAQSNPRRWTNLRLQNSEHNSNRKNSSKRQRCILTKAALKEVCT